jgi:polymorphic toxin system nucleotidyltransferase-like protein
MSGTVHRKFSVALDELVGQIKQDRSILAVILCGSLSHDTVWAKSDIDLVLVTIDDKKVDAGDIALYADGVNVHAQLMPRTRFRQTVEGSATNSFIHSYLAKGRLLYTHDPSIAELCEHLSRIGDRDTQFQLLNAATNALACIHKAHKWFVTRADLDYTALWILYAATPLAQIEIISRGLLADREVVPQAMALNPEFFKVIYTEMLNSKKTTRLVHAALDAVDGYVAERADLLFAPIVEYLQEAGEARSASEIETYFTRQFNATGVTTACEYLSDQGRIGKASTAARLTKRSNADVQELAFFAQ